jgi:hypothetical protein
MAYFLALALPLRQPLNADMQMFPVVHVYIRSESV